MEQDTCRPDIFQRLFFRHASGLRRFVYYQSGNWTSAEDLVQEAFVRLWNNCRDVPADKAKSFLFTVAQRLFLDDTRRQKVALKFQAYSAGAQQDATPGPDYQVEMQEFQQKLEQALADLPENQRVVFLMNRIDKMTYAEIATQLDLSVKAVEKRMHLALLALRHLGKI